VIKPGFLWVTENSRLGRYVVIKAKFSWNLTKNLSFPQRLFYDPILLSVDFIS